MKVLFVIDEVHPLYKIGGLGDVGGSLPIALSKDHKLDLRIALPRHPEITLPPHTVTTDHFTTTYNNQNLSVTVLLTTLPNTNIPVYLFQEDTYLSQKTDASDNHADKFAVFSLIIADWISRPSPTFAPHILHLHDWHTALVPVILKHRFHNKKVKSIITIHNLVYQGNTDTPVASRLGLSENACQILSWDKGDSHINILLEGILHSEITTTVSPTYAKEILTDEYGCQIDDFLTTQKGHLYGILNGLNLDLFNPQSDPLIYSNFSVDDYSKGKTENKLKLQNELKLPQDPNQILLGFVGRVDPGQKGVQLIIKALNSSQLTPDNTQFVFLGTGDEHLQDQLLEAAKPNAHVRIIPRYDEPLAAKIYAASDLMLIPSQYEPCGLVQMIAMRYGALPIARKTGGLADTIIHNQDGFLFNKYSTKAMTDSIQHAVQYISDPKHKHTLTQAAMNKDFSWDQSAKRYYQLYQQLILDELQSDS